MGVGTKEKEGLRRKASSAPSRVEWPQLDGASLEEIEKVQMAAAVIVQPCAEY